MDVRIRITPKNHSPTVRKVVVDRVVFGRKLGKEQLGEIRNPRIRILQTLRHLAQLSLDLNHPVEDQMRQNHERVFLDDETGIGKTLIQLVTVVVENAAKANCYISERDDDVAADIGVF